jgi:hypothetical protein
MDRERGRQRGLPLDPRSLPLVGLNGQILERDRRLEECVLVLGRALEVEGWLFAACLPSTSLNASTCARSTAPTTCAASAARPRNAFMRSASV